MNLLEIQKGNDFVFRPLELQKSSFNCSQIWDSKNAQFTPCSLPFVQAIPAIVAVLALLAAIVHFLPWRVPSPQWLKAFVEEPVEHRGDLTVRHKYYFLRPCYVLLLFSAHGFGAQIASALYPAFQRDTVFPLAAWVAAIAILAIQRPVTTPTALLVLYVSIFTAQTILLVDGTSATKHEHVPIVIAMVAALGAIVTILLMPMRHPIRDSGDISPAFGLPTSLLRSPEDNLSLWQWMSVSWMAPLISVGNTRQLNDEDVWNLGYQFQHRLLHDNFRRLPGSVLKRLLDANGIDLLIISVLSIIDLTATFSVTVLLQKILQTMEDSGAPQRATLTYVVLTLVIGLVKTQCGVFSLWFGRRAYERSRGELITMLYEKTLSRKVVSISSKLQENSITTNGTGKHGKESGWTKPISYVLKVLRLRKKEDTTEASRVDDKAKELATMGKIMNLMRFDAYEVSQRFWEFSILINQPLGLILSVVLIWKIIGWPCLIGVVTVFLAQGVNALLARALLRWEKDRRVATDNKLHKVSQLVESIRHLRWYGWQDVWLSRIMEARQHELYLRIVSSIWRILITFTNVFASGMFPVAAFYAYTVWAEKPLTIDVAFPALQLFSILETNLRDLPNLITILLNARVAMGRIEDFMSEPNKEDAETDLISTGEIGMNNASFAWPGATEPILRDITLSISPGLTVICGEVGAGKTALLQALLGEMDQLAGEYHRTSEMVGYCGQTPWLQSMSIRENILFSAPYEEPRYKQVLEACALIPDMATFKRGDLSMVGENGVGLSGGQKARVSLARAVYSTAKILLLDDPLSALDHQTAESIVRKCLAGSLLKNRTVILVTHRTELCLGLASQAIELSNGRARQIDPETIPFVDLHQVNSADSEHEDSKDAKSQEAAATPEKFMDDEHREHGGVKAAVYWEYIKAGKLRWWGILIIALALYRTVDIAETWFLKQWGEAYGNPSGHVRNGPFGEFPSPEKNIKPWLIGFTVIAAAQSVAFLIAQAFMVVIVYQAGKDLFERVMTKCTHATFRFYDVTPVGRLMNRLTSDINTVDGNISYQFQFVVMLIIAWVSSIVVIASITPFFLLFAVALTITYIFIFSYFLPTSQSLRRLEMVSLTPLISNFGELTAGLTTIRAYGAASRFQSRVIDVTDKFQKMDHFYWSLQAWLMFRFDSLSATSTFLITILALYTGVSAGLTAFVLTAASRFVASTHALCRQYGQLQMDFVSVERVVELLYLDQEPPGAVEPPAYWPSLGGDIIFEDVTIQYAPNLDPALIDISLTIKGGSTTALIGRTGSGKSTLALALLATTLPSSGRIIIDGIDISTISTQALRSRVTFLAQEPVLFPGSMRQNLDPLSEYSDGECIAVIEKIAGRHQWTLDTHIDTGGRNLSQGQRQLVGLARALLRRSAIVIMDEATASIDMETAMRIQEILRDEMKESTVITIAHRVEAVKNAQFCVVLGKGKVVEVGPAGGLVERME